VKELGSAFKRREDIPEVTENAEGTSGIDPVQMSLLLDDDDVVEIGVPEPDEIEDIEEKEVSHAAE